LTAWRFPGLESVWKVPVLGNPVGLTLSSDGLKAALVFPKRGAAGYVQLIEATTGKELSKVLLPADQSSPFVGGLAFWKNRYVVMGFKGHRHPLIILDTEKGEECTAAFLAGDGEELGTADDLQFSPDGDKVLMLDALGFSLWRVDGHQPPEKLMSGASAGYDAPVMFREGAFSADARRIAIATYDGCRIYDVKSGELVKQLSMGAGAVKYSPDGKRLLLVDGPRLHVISTDTWEPSNQNLGARSSLSMLAFQAKGTLLAASDGFEIFVWNTTDGSLLARLPRPDSDLYISTLTFHPDNRHVIAGDGKQFWTWDLSAIGTDPSKPAPGTPDPASFFKWDKAPDLLHALSIKYINDGKALLLIRQKGAWLATRDPDSEKKPMLIKKFSLDGLADVDWLFAAGIPPSMDWLAVGTYNKLRIYKLNPDTLQTEFKTGDNGEQMAFSDDARWCAYNSGPMTSEITVRTLPEGKVEALLPLKEESPKGRKNPGSKAFSHNTKILAAAVHDNMAPWYGFYLWDVPSLQRVNAVETGAGSIGRLAFGDNDRSLATLNTNNTISLWDVSELLQSSPK